MSDDARIDYQAPALEKGLDILELLAERTDALSPPEISKALHRSRNEIYRMLVVLARRGYLVRDSDDRYRVSSRLFELGMRTPPLRNLHDAALPLMHMLAERLHQSCHLVVASGDEMIVVARVESPANLGFAVRVGYRRPLVQSTSGRILLTFRPEAQRVAWLDAQHLGVAEREAFLADCAQAREDGFFAGASALVDAVTDVGAPVFAGEESAIASLTMPFVSGRSARTSLNTAIATLRETADLITARLTHG